MANYENELKQLEQQAAEWQAEIDAMPLDNPASIYKPRLSAIWALCQLKDRISRIREAQRRGY